MILTAMPKKNHENIVLFMTYYAKIVLAYCVKDKAQ